MSHFLHRRLVAGVLGLLLQVERRGGDVSGGGVPNPDVCTHTLYSAVYAATAHIHVSYKCIRMSHTYAISRLGKQLLQMIGLELKRVRLVCSGFSVLHELKRVCPVSSVVFVSCCVRRWLDERCLSPRGPRAVRNGKQGLEGLSALG